MMTPLLRSRCFWSGILVLACIGGLWVDSMYRERAVVAHRGVFVESGGVIHGEAVFQAFFQYSPGVSPTEPWHMVVEVQPEEEGGTWFPSPKFEVIRHPTTVHYELDVPHWLVGLLVLAAWAGLLLQRRRGSGRGCCVIRSPFRSGCR